MRAGRSKLVVLQRLARAAVSNDQVCVSSNAKRAYCCSVWQTRTCRCRNILRMSSVAIGADHATMRTNWQGEDDARLCLDLRLESVKGC